MKPDVYIHNRFDIEVRDAKSGELKQQAYAENIILDIMWSQEAWRTQGWALHIFIGTGTGTLAASRTTMFNQLARLTGVSPTYAYDKPNRVHSKRIQAAISETQYNGSVIKEIGVGGYYYNAGTYHLCTHALLRDMNGNAVELTKTDTDIITFFATVYAYIPESFDSGAIRPFPHFKTPLVSHLLGDTAWPTSTPIRFSKCMDFFCDNPSYTDFDAVSKTASIAHDATGKIWTYTVPRLAVGEGNVAGGLYGAMDSMGLVYNLLDSSVFAGSALVGEALGTGNGTLQDFKTAFGLVAAGATVKVDGVADGTVTVDVGKPADNNLIRHMKLIETTNLNLAFGLQNYGFYFTTSDYIICENPLYATYGIDTIKCNAFSVFCSDDGTNWTSLGAGSAAKDVSANRTKRYWKFVGVGGTTWGYYLDQFLSNDLTTAVLKNVHFTSPPAAGAVLTIDYTTDALAKDIYHVFDSTLRVTLGEYTP